MNWIKIAAIVVMLLGVGSGGFLIAQRPDFWLSMAGSIIREAIPVLKERMTPEKEKEMQTCIRRGGQWDHIKKRCKR
jgi:hypothetical protein